MFDYVRYKTLDSPYNPFDWALVSTGWLMITLYGFILTYVNRLKLVKTHRTDSNITTATRTANFLLGVHVLVGLLVFAWRIGSNPVVVPLLLIYRVLATGGILRFYLLTFWLLNVFATLGYCVRTAMHVKTINTAHRKFFHLTVSLVATTGFWYDPAFGVLCGNLIIQLFVLLEILRVHRAWPWAAPLNELMLPFLDHQDSADLILTPIHLIGGVFLPSALELVFGSNEVSGCDLPRYFVGVVVVGIGDSAAAVLGSRFGRWHWGVDGRKTVEGSAAMFVTQLLTHGFLFGWTSAFASPTVWIVYAICTLVEAGLGRNDNVILPVVGFAGFRLFDLMFGT